jgi:hypothetical protein
MVIMSFRDNRLNYLRQFFYSPQSDSLRDAMAEITRDRTGAPRAYVMVSDGVDAARQRQDLEEMFHIQIEMPSLKRILRNEEASERLWPAIGAALLSLKPKGQLNLTGNGKPYLFLSTKTALHFSAALAACGLLMTGLFFLDDYFMQRTYQYLVSEPNRIYSLSFPKSPPVRDPVRMFREKIRLMEKEPGSVAAVTNPLSILNEISSKIGPDLDVKLNEFASNEKEFTLSGTTTSFASAERIKSVLEQVKGVSQVEIQNLDLAPGRQVKFKMRAKL